VSAGEPSLRFGWIERPVEAVLSIFISELDAAWEVKRSLTFLCLGANPGPGLASWRQLDAVTPLWSGRVMMAVEDALTEARRATLGHTPFIVPVATIVTC
jgi:hypothetical protein